MLTNAGFGPRGPARLLEGSRARDGLSRLANRDRMAMCAASEDDEDGEIGFEPYERIDGSNARTGAVEKLEVAGHRDAAKAKISNWREGRRRTIHAPVVEALYDRLRLQGPGDDLR